MIPTTFLAMFPILEAYASYLREVSRLKSPVLRRDHPTSTFTALTSKSRAVGGPWTGLGRTPIHMIPPCITYRIQLPRRTLERAEQTAHRSSPRASPERY